MGGPAFRNETWALLFETRAGAPLPTALAALERFATAGIRAYVVVCRPVLEYSPHAATHP